MTIQAGPLLSSLIDLESGATLSSATFSFIPLALSLAGFLLAFLLYLRDEQDRGAGRARFYLRRRSKGPG